MQIKTKMKYYLTSVTLAIIIKGKLLWGRGEKGTFMYSWWDYKLVQPLWKTVCSFLKKLKTELLYDLAIPLLDTYLKKTKHMYLCVHCSIIYNSQDVEATYVFIHRWMHKDDVIDT